MQGHKTLVRRLKSIVMEDGMGWRLRILFDDGSDELVDEIFATEEEAEAEYDSWLDSWSVGTETLMLAGEDYVDADITDCDIWQE